MGRVELLTMDDAGERILVKLGGQQLQSFQWRESSIRSHEEAAFDPRSERGRQALPPIAERAQKHTDSKEALLAVDYKARTYGTARGRRQDHRAEEMLLSRVLAATVERQVGDVIPKFLPLVALPRVAALIERHAQLMPASKDCGNPGLTCRNHVRPPTRCANASGDANVSAKSSHTQQSV